MADQKPEKPPVRLVERLEDHVVSASKVETTWTVKLPPGVPMAPAEESGCEICGGQSKRLEEEAKQGKSDMTNARSTLAAATDMVDRQQEAVAKAEAELSERENLLEEVSGKAPALASQVDGLAGRIDSLNDQVTGAEQRLAELRDAGATVRKEQSEVDQKLVELKSRSAALTASKLHESPNDYRSAFVDYHSSLGSQLSPLEKSKEAGGPTSSAVDRFRASGLEKLDGAWRAWMKSTRDKSLAAYLNLVQEVFQAAQVATKHCVNHASKVEEYNKARKQRRRLSSKERNALEEAISEALEGRQEAIAELVELHESWQKVELSALEVLAKQLTKEQLAKMAPLLERALKRFRDLGKKAPDAATRSYWKVVYAFGKEECGLAEEAGKQALSEKLPEQFQSLEAEKRKLADRLREMNAETSAVRKSKGTASGESGKLDTQLATLRNQLSKAQETESRLQAGMDWARDRREEASVALAKAADELANAKRAYDDSRDVFLTSANAAAASRATVCPHKGGCEPCNDTVASLVARVGSLTTKHDLLKTKLAQARDALRTKQATTDDDKAEIARANKSKGVFAGRLMKFDRMLVGHRLGLDKVAKQVETLKNQEQAKKLEAADLKKKIQTLEPQVRELEQAFAKARTQLSEVTRDRRQVESDLEQAGTDRTSVISRMRGLKARIRHLRSLPDVRVIQAEYNAARDQFTRLADKLDGPLRRVRTKVPTRISDNIRVANQALALGDKLARLWSDWVGALSISDARKEQLLKEKHVGDTVLALRKLSASVHGNGGVRVKWPGWGKNTKSETSWISAAESARAKLKAVEPQLVDLTRREQPVADQLRKYEMELSGLTKRLKTIDTSIADLERKLEGLKQRQGSLARSVRSLDAKLQGAQRRLESLRSDLQTVDLSLREISSDLRSQQGDKKRLSDAVTTDKALANNLTSALGQVKGKLAQSAKKSDTTSKDVGTAAARVAQLSAQVAALRAQLRAALSELKQAKKAECTHPRPEPEAPKEWEYVLVARSSTFDVATTGLEPLGITGPLANARWATEEDGDLTNREGTEEDNPEPFDFVTTVRLDPKRKKDAKITLKSEDYVYEATKTLTDDIAPGGEITTLQYEAVLPGRRYDLTVDYGKGRTERVFRNKILGGSDYQGPFLPAGSKVFLRADALGCGVGAEATIRIYEFDGAEEPVEELTATVGADQIIQAEWTWEPRGDMDEIEGGPDGEAWAAFAERQAQQAAEAVVAMRVEVAEAQASRRAYIKERREANQQWAKTRQEAKEAVEALAAAAKAKAEANKATKEALVEMREAARAAAASARAQAEADYLKNEAERERREAIVAESRARWEQFEAYVYRMVAAKEQKEAQAADAQRRTEAAEFVKAQQEAVQQQASADEAEAKAAKEKFEAQLSTFVAVIEQAQANCASAIAAREQKEADVAAKAAKRAKAHALFLHWVAMWEQYEANRARLAAEQEVLEACIAICTVASDKADLQSKLQDVMTELSEAVTAVASALAEKQEAEAAWKDAEAARAAAAVAYEVAKTEEKEAQEATEVAQTEEQEARKAWQNACVQWCQYRDAKLKADAAQSKAKAAWDSAKTEWNELKDACEAYVKERDEAQKAADKAKEELAEAVAARKKAAAEWAQYRQAAQEAREGEEAAAKARDVAKTELREAISAVKEAVAAHQEADKAKRLAQQEMKEFTQALQQAIKEQVEANTALAAYKVEKAQAKQAAAKAEKEAKQADKALAIYNKKRASREYRLPIYFFEVEVQGFKANSGVAMVADCVEGVLADEDSTPLPGEILSFRLIDNSARDVTADAEGNYRLHPAPPGGYDLRIKDKMLFVQPEEGNEPPTLARWPDQAPLVSFTQTDGLKELGGGK